jgi:hypothetical protein
MQFEQATKNLTDRTDCNPNDYEAIQYFLIEFAEHILMHTTPAAGSTIKKYQGMSVEQIVVALPDMPEME